MPLRKLVPNRARSFDVCLEKRKLVSEAGTGKGAGTRILAVGKPERGARRGPEQCLAKVTRPFALSDQEAQEPGHSPWHVPV